MNTSNIIEERVPGESIYEYGASSILGTRKYQQDFAYVYLDETSILAAVCDGMGGMEGGERASKCAIECLATDAKANRSTLKNSARDFFMAEAQRMNASVRALDNGYGSSINGGTTFVGAFLKEDSFYWVSVGDSRIWMIRDEKIMTINRDHNYRLSLKENLRSGLIDQDFYDRESRSPKADALISYLGIERLDLVDTNSSPLRLIPGDMVILSSDGVYKSLTDSQVCAMVTDNDIDMSIAADRTNEMALRYGVHGQDNTTIVCIRYKG